MTDWNDLESLDEAYANAASDSEKVPDGTYQAQVDRVELRRSQAGNPYLNWQLRIRGGQFDGQCLFKMSMLVTDKNLSHLKKDTATCGVTLAKVSDLAKEQVLRSLLDHMLEVKATTSGEFQNVYINKRIITRDSAPHTAEMDHRGVDDDDIPF